MTATKIQLLFMIRGEHLSRKAEKKLPKLVNVLGKGLLREGGGGGKAFRKSFTSFRKGRVQRGSGGEKRQRAKRSVSQSEKEDGGV